MCVTILIKTQIRSIIEPMNKVCPHCKMTQDTKGKYCDKDCYRVSRMSDRTDDTFELKPHFKEEIKKKLKGI